MPSLLHLGSGSNGREQTPKEFHGEEWTHTTVDLDTDAEPDIVDDAATLDRLDGRRFDAIYTCHMLEHLHYNVAIDAIRRWYDLTAQGGHLIVVVPNLKSALEKALEVGLWGEPVYEAPAGPIYPMDIIYGHTGLSYLKPYMQHKCGFTMPLLKGLVAEAGYKVTQAIEEVHNLTVIGRRL